MTVIGSCEVLLQIYLADKLLQFFKTNSLLDKQASHFVAKLPEAWVIKLTGNALELIVALPDHIKKLDLHTLDLGHLVWLVDIYSVSLDLYNLEDMN